jgi:glycosyltransferase involved in cell wall biosynthesis
LATGQKTHVQRGRIAGSLVFPRKLISPVPSEPPLVSIIMSMRNGAATVRDAIISLQWQTLRNWELILFDDGSTDNSIEVVSSILDDRIRLQGDKEHQGLAARLNQAVDSARGRFIARMDADDICFPGRLQKQVAYLENHPDIDLVASRAVVFSGRDLIGVLPIDLSHRDIVRRPFHGFAFPHPTWCGRSEWFRDNPYDKSLGKTQDQDLLLRSFAHSKFGGMQDVLVGYRQGRLEMTKLLRGRSVFIRSVWRHGRALGPLSSVIRGMTSQFIKAAADVVIFSMGMSRLSQVHRLQIVPYDVQQAWQLICAQLPLSETA